MESNHFSFTFFLVGIGFFIYGLKITSEQLKQIFSDQLRSVIKTLTRNPVYGFFMGLSATVIFQSAIAPRGLLIGFASVGIITIERSIPVLLGSDVGSALLSFFFATFSKFNLLPLAHGLIIFGILGYFVLKKNYRNHAKMIMSFGFVFYGLALMGMANGPLRESELFKLFLENVLQQPFWAFIVGFLLTSFLQSSVIVLGILITFSYSGLIPIQEAIPFILGANLGSATATFLLGSTAQGDGKYVAYSSLLFKCVGTAIFFPIYPYFATWLSQLAEIPPYQIAWAHVIYNVVIALIFLPLIKVVSKFMRSKFPVDHSANKFQSKFLDVASLDSATIAFANVSREISRMAAIVEEMCKILLKPFEEKGRDTIIRIDEMDDQVDQLDREIKFYLARIHQEELSAKQSRKGFELLMFTNNLEAIGDIINRNMMVLVEKKRRSGITFSKEAWNEINNFHDKVLENFKLALAAFVTGDIELGKKVLRNKKFLTSLEQELGQIHMNRSRQAQDKELIEALSIYMDLLSNLRLMNSFVCKMAYPTLDRRTEPDPIQ